MRSPRRWSGSGQTLIDVEHVAPCLPGAAVTGRNDDGSYNGTFKVKIGPTSASYTGKLAMENIDEAAHTATMEAQGTDKRGQGGAKATIVSSRLDAGNGQRTRVEVVTDYHITGRLARFGRGGMIEDISDRLLGDFAKCLQTSLAAPPETFAAPVADSAAAPAEPAAPAPRVPETAAARAAASVEAAAAEAVAREAAAREAAAAEAVAREAAAAEAAAPEAPADTPERAADTVVSPVPEWTRADAETEDVPPQEPSSEAPTEAAPPPEPAVTASSEPAPPPPAPPAPPPPPVSPPPPPTAAQPPPLANPPMPTEPMQGLSLMGSVVWGRIKRNPAPAAAAGVAVVLLIARRRRRRG